LVFCKSKYRMKMSADLSKIMDGREPWITCECSGAADRLFQSTQTQIKGSDFGVDDHRVPRRFQKQYEMLIATSSYLQWTVMPSATQPPLSTTL
jgi:predicted nucleic acid-binding Zn ribbon protein